MNFNSKKICSDSQRQNFSNFPVIATKIATISKLQSSVGNSQARKVLAVVEIEKNSHIRLIPCLYNAAIAAKKRLKTILGLKMDKKWTTASLNSNFTGFHK